MFTKGTKFYSIVTGTCPKCQNGHMYVNNNPYIINQTMKMQEHCTSCGFKFKIEPNFFFGAMYVSYAISVLTGVALFLLCHFVFRTSLQVAFMAIFGSLVLLMPLITRYSRNIYINLFVNYSREESGVGI